MSSILLKGVIRNGRVEVAEPIDLPDGTELLFSVPDGTSADDEDGWDVSPAGIDAWLKWCDSLQPLKITPEEQADTEEWLKKINDYGTANRDRGIEDLFP